MVIQAVVDEGDGKTASVYLQVPGVHLADYHVEGLFHVPLESVGKEEFVQCFKMPNSVRNWWVQEVLIGDRGQFRALLHREQDSFSFQRCPFLQGERYSWDGQLPSRSDRLY